jgi:hypothetical protein
MNFNFIHPETWVSLNQKVHELWKLPEDISVRVYRGVPHAAYELALGTAFFLSHKRSVGHLHGQTSAFQPVLPFLYKEGFQVQQLSRVQPATPVGEWLKALKPDNSFVMHVEDNAITGETFSFEEVDTILHDKKIFSIRVSHQRHWYEPRNMTPSSVQICEFSPGLAVALCGSRFKSPVQISSFLPWSELEVLREIERVRPPMVTTPQLVTDFEAKLPEGFQSFVKSGERLFDRSLIYHPEIQGEALATELKKCLKLPQDSRQVTSTSSCQWGFMDWGWWENKPPAEILRSLVILDSEILNRSDLKGALGESFQTCRV